MDRLEQLVIEAFDSGSTSEVIRPAARLNEAAARAVLVELALRDVRNGGHWYATAARWDRYDRCWGEPDAPADARLIGSIQIAYGTPTTYEITIYRATVTRVGATDGWTVESLCDEALGFVQIDLADCPRVDLLAAPEPFRPG